MFLRAEKDLLVKRGLKRSNETEGGNLEIAGEGDEECQTAPRLGRMRSEKSVDFIYLFIFKINLFLYSYFG